MKKVTMIRQRSTLAGSALLLVAIAGCGDGETQVEEAVPTTVEISPGSAMLTAIDATQGFTAVVRDQNGRAMSNAAVSWSSSDASVFSVNASGSSATVTAAGNGTGTLTATSGQASGTAAVEVEQTPTRVEIVSGDEQEGIREQPLPEPLVVRVEDQGGTAVAGVQVNFIPDPESGSVSEGQVNTDPNGMASTVWTLGSKRTQSLTVEAATAQIKFSATAVSENPIPDYTVSGDLMFTRLDPLDTDTIEISVDITNLGDGAGPETFMVQLTVDGTAVQTLEVGQVEPEATTTVTFTAGPFEEGTRRVGVEIDPEGEVEEWEEENNSGSGILTVLAQQSISLDESVTVESSSTGPVLLYRVELAEASDEALNVELSGGEGDADLFVHYNDRPDHHYKYRCFSGNADATEDCQLVPARAGTYHIAVHAFTAFGPSTLKVTIGGRPVEPFDLELVFLDGGTSSQDNIVRQAAERWEAVLARDLNWDADYTNAPFPAGQCGPGSPQVSDVVDDLRVFVTIDSIDGVGGILGSSSICSIRTYPFTGATAYLQPVLGAMVLDEDDVARMEADGTLLSVVTHELAHVLGFSNVVWDLHDRLRNPSLPSSPNADTHFEGPLAIPAFDAAGGVGYGRAKVPVQNGAESGSSDSHWRQSVFEDEMMTPFLTGNSQPMSLITIESLYDLGYETNPAEAESYTLSSAGMAGMALPRGPVVDLRNDIMQIPIRVFVLPWKGRK